MGTAQSASDIMRAAAHALENPQHIAPDVPIKVGVDLGTAFTVIAVTDEQGKPLALANTFADVVRDGVVWDFAGAQETVRRLKDRLEQITGRTLDSGAVTVPPAVGNSNHRTHQYVIEGAGIDCTDVVDETIAANAVLGITDGAVVDIGGGTTGVAILRDGKVIANIDEPSGGTHLSLVISGSFGIPFEEAEARKVDPSNQRELMGVVRPTLEKMASIVRNSVSNYNVDSIHLVGGTAAFCGIADVMTSITGIPTIVAPEPMLVTPLGAASFAKSIISEESR